MQVIETRQGRVSRVLFAPDGRSLLTASDRGRTVCLCDLRAGKVARRWAVPAGGVTGLAWSPGRPLVAASDGAGVVWAWDADSGAVRFRAGSTGGAACCVAFSPDGQTLAAGGRRGRGGAEVRRWDADTFRRRAGLEGYHGGVTALAFTPDGRTLATGGRDHAVRLWDANGVAERTPVSRALEYLGGVFGWLTGAGYPAGEAGTRPAARGRSVVRSLAFSPDGSLLAAAAGWSASLWEVPGPGQALRPRAALRGHKALLDAVSFSPDGRGLLTAGRDGRVKLWDADSGEERATFAWDVGPAYAVAFAPDGLRAAVGGSAGRVVVWDVGE